MTRNGIRSPMMSTVVTVLVTVGQTVRAGEVLMILEAMKMEHEVRAPGAGEVLAVHAATGATVAKDAVLVELGDAAGDDDGDKTTTTTTQRHPGRRHRRTPRRRRVCGQISARRATVTRSRSTRRGPTRSRGGTRRGSGPRARTSPTSCDPGSFSSTARSPRGPDQPPHARRPDGEHARPTAWSPGIGGRQRRAVRRRGVALRR